LSDKVQALAVPGRPPVTRLQRRFGRRLLSAFHPLRTCWGSSIRWHLANVSPFRRSHSFATGQRPVRTLRLTPTHAPDVLDDERTIVSSVARWVCRRTHPAAVANEGQCSLLTNRFTTTLGSLSRSGGHIESPDRDSFDGRTSAGSTQAAGEYDQGQGLGCSHRNLSDLRLSQPMSAFHPLQTFDATLTCLNARPSQQSGHLGSNRFHT
jgi:hypothetical protein